MFSYAVAVQDVWAFHWHNISGRLSVFFLSLLPAEAFVGLTGDPGAGIVVYGLLFYLAPLAGLIATFAADRSRGRIIFAYACCSTALLCPLIFGFPTEMWLAHAVFWPALAVSHYARRSAAGTALVFVMLLMLAFTHEGALVLAATIVATLAPRGLRDAPFCAGRRPYRGAGDGGRDENHASARRLLCRCLLAGRPSLLRFHHLSGGHRRAVVRGARRIRCYLSGAFAARPDRAYLYAAVIVVVMLHILAGV